MLFLKNIKEEINLKSIQNITKTTIIIVSADFSFEQNLKPKPQKMDEKN
jgi:hypothetical protein